VDSRVLRTVYTILRICPIFCYHFNMVRIARVIWPGIPNHFTLRGNWRRQTFFCDDDYLASIELMGNWCRKP